MKINKLGIQYGLLSVAIIVMLMTPAWLIIGEEVGYQISRAIGYGVIAVAFIPIVLALLIKRHRAGNVLRFRDGMLTALLITTMASLAYLFVWLIIIQFRPDIVELMWDLYEHNLGNDPSEADLAELAKFKEYYKSPLKRIMMTLSEIAPFGFAVSFLTSLILRRKPKADLA